MRRKPREFYVCKLCDIELIPDGDTYICENCGREYSEDELDDLTTYVTFDDPDDMPSGCKACGGPYPSCKTSCKLFDD